MSRLGCMRRAALRVLLLGGMLLLGTGTAAAQSGSVSYSLWSLDGHRVTMRFLLPAAEANRIAGTDIDVLTMSRFASYLLDHTAVQAAGQNCPAIDQGYDIGKVDPLTVGAGLDGFEIFFQCDQPQEIVLEEQIDGGPFAQQLFTAAHQWLSLPTQGTMPSAGILRYVSLGGRHVLGSLARWCFLLGAWLLVRRARPLAGVIGGLAAGYALSIPLALLGSVTPHAVLLEAFLGLLVALLAGQLLARQLERERLVALGACGLLLWMAAMALFAHAGARVWLLAGAGLFAGGFLCLRQRPSAIALGPAALGVLFGLLDGWLLPAQLLPLQLPVRTQWPMLAGFDVGALLAEALVLAALLAAGFLAQQWSGWPRRMAARALLRDVVTAALGALGLFWLVSGLHG